MKEMPLEPCEFFHRKNYSHSTFYEKTYFAWGEIKREFKFKLYVKNTLKNRKKIKSF